jgi:hypothetical protein
MITKIINLPEKTKDELAYERLIKDFNEEAAKQKSNYRINLYCTYPHLFWKFFVLNQIFWDYNEDEYSFIGGIRLERFEKLKSILEKINSKIEVDIVK